MLISLICMCLEVFFLSFSFFSLTPLYLLTVGVEVIVAPDHTVTHKETRAQPRAVDLAWTKDRPIAVTST